MAKSNKVFHCLRCYWQTKKFVDSCGGCGGLNTLTKAKIIISEIYSPKMELISRQHSTEVDAPAEDTTISLDEVEDLNYTCFKTGIESLDEVLGGGIFTSSAIFLGAEAGTGKTTLCLQVADKYAAKKMRVLYLCGEESAAKVKATAKRVKAKLPAKYFRFSMGKEMEKHHANIETFDPDLVICDSLDVMSTENATSGELAQKKAVVLEFMDICHDDLRPRSGLAISHLNANGELAGNEKNRHMLDVVLMLENEFGFIKCYCDKKNRNGRSDISRYFSMDESGLKSVKPEQNAVKKSVKHTERMED